MTIASVKLSAIHPGERYTMVPVDSEDKLTLVKTAADSAHIIDLGLNIAIDPADASNIQVYPLDRPVDPSLNASNAVPGNATELELGTWMHHERGEVKVYSTATDHAAQKEVAYFYVVSTNSYWSRPVSDFHELVEKDGGVMVPRFVKVP